MCRLVAFPPGFSRRNAIRILEEFYVGNDDGVGYSFVYKKKFAVAKWPYKLPKALKQAGNNFLNHMPHDGWTIAHLRAASHGQNTYHNTHPFLVGNWAFCHNGIWGNHDLVRPILEKFGVEIQGQTDSEIAAHMFNIMGPKSFSTIMSGGVYLGLHRNGNLWAVKTHGDLVFGLLEKKRVVVSSTLNDKDYPDQKEGRIGWYKFDNRGRLVAKKVERVEKYAKNIVLNTDTGATPSFYGNLSGNGFDYPFANSANSANFANMPSEGLGRHHRPN